MYSFMKRSICSLSSLTLSEGSKSMSSPCLEENRYLDRTGLAVRREVEALVKAGAKIIQIDEPATSVRPEELQIAIDGLRVVTEGLPAYFITHICFGAFELIYPGMLTMPVDNFDLEMSNSGLDMLALFRKNAFTKDISFGVVDVHSHVIESEALVEERLREALQVLPKEIVWVDPDCGLKTRSVEEAIAKMQTLVRVAKALRN